MNKLEDPTSQTVDAVAEAEGVETIALDTPLAEVVDPDALETLIEDSATSTLKFSSRIGATTMLSTTAVAYRSTESDHHLSPNSNIPPTATPAAASGFNTNSPRSIVAWYGREQCSR
jgi:hypothetical protein